MVDRTEMFRAWDAAAERTRAAKLPRWCEVAERVVKAEAKLAAAKRARRRPGATVVRRPTLADFMEARRAKGGAS